ncbi:hypothetical protein M0R72_14580 [Candidatus Pacearchaeota archaeon]|nr:hypothetical protein [Candidatus Pacearchaeota archaeon]
MSCSTVYGLDLGSNRFTVDGAFDYETSQVAASFGQFTACGRPMDSQETSARGPRTFPRVPAGLRCKSCERIYEVGNRGMGVSDNG